jgi:uncharacterized membrane protein
MSLPPPAIEFVRYSAPRGVYWIRHSYTMLSAQRARWLLLLLIYYPLLGLIDLVPFVGQFAVPLLKPVFAVGFLAAAWAQERGAAPEPRHLFQGFRSNLGALLLLGAFLLVGLTLAVFGSALVDGGKLIGFLTNPPVPPSTPAEGGIGAAATADGTAAELILSDPRVQAGMLFAVACGLPVVMALWFAPALVVFQDCSARQALATSLRATLANWRPIAVYGLLLFFWGGVVPGIAAALIATAAPKSLAFVIALLALFPYVLLFTATLHISDYVAYRDIFHAGEEGSAAPADNGASS